MLLYIYSQIIVLWEPKVFLMSYCLNGKFYLKILRSLWVIDKSTHYLICSRHKSIEKQILSYITADKDLYESSKTVLDETEYMRRDYLSDIVDSFIIGNTKFHLMVVMLFLGIGI